MIVNNVRLDAVMIESGDFADVSYRGPRNVFTVGRTYGIDEVPWTVLAIKPSPYVDGVTNVKLRRDV